MKQRKNYIGDPEPTDLLDKHAEEVAKLTPNFDHVRRTYRPKSGRPTSLTPEIIEDVTLLVAGGSSIPEACAACGIPKSLWANWNNKAKQALEEGGYEAGFATGQNPYLAWFEAVSEAKASWIVSALNRIDRQLPGWQAVAWILERRYPGYYMQRTQQTLNVKAEPMDKLSTAELKKLAEEND